MDYAPFFAQSPQPFFHMSIPATPSYSGDDPKLGPTVSSPNPLSNQPLKLYPKSCCPHVDRLPHKLTTAYIQEPMDTQVFSQNPFDSYRFSSGLPQDDLISAGDGMPLIGSVDSGLGNDGMGNEGLDFLNQGENSYQHDRRSSSEEKDNLTPAQSKRKAQNRAAYVQSSHQKQNALYVRVISHTTNQSYLHADNELFAKEKNDMSKILKPSFMSSNPLRPP